MQNSNFYDVIVIGCGHAGAEACLAAARMGAKTLLVTHNIETIGELSCNPSIGGIGKGHLVKELDAMGGAMGAVTDAAGIQFRILNASKGPAVRATRAQIDRTLYKTAMRECIENQENLWVIQQAVDDVLVENNRTVGIRTKIGLEFKRFGTCRTIALLRRSCLRDPEPSSCRTPCGLRNASRAIKDRNTCPNRRPYY